ncbi:uroporphyrinogen-III synthase [Desulfotomaculum arcticum]|uniref:uroporphyrinogen-III C-methyltransferase n=1 Tax=Desulfotruncus arcticus DSM 17038 TaxID=1121424 RepID=A0A1I2ND37_9FIRM|nr:uroporphyrinogen-III C-methyltransferase [Desulfotruncus arcticus]SFG01835.1 uroporphyrinogen-III synthase [Desulfotomaculum arcticum] [Desulfotruncus arcticus DSM 17038]
MMVNKGTVYLIGAGPGDPSLITVKGLVCIKQADVIVYDRLASPRLLDYRRPDAEIIFAGKQPDRHTLTQSEINELLVNKAKEGLAVARLKGGDPFVFGRGGEEAEELSKHGIPFEIVPGITSAVAVPAYAGIPVTHRDFTSSVSIITGNEDPTKENSNIEWAKLATGTGTLIFLMGMSNLPAIANRLMEYGRSPRTPVALIRWGTRPEQKTLIGDLASISHLAVEQGFKNPAIIIVGEVVKLREKLKWFENKPLFSQRILVTRSREQASVLSQLIENLGGEPVEFPTITIADPENFAPLDNSIKTIDTYNWIVFTSVNGVKSFIKRFQHFNRDIRDLKGIRLCAIGPRTGKELRSLALNVDYIPSEYRAEEIVEGLKHKISRGDKILLPRADIARKLLPESLRALGAEVDEVIAYRTLAASINSDTIKEMLAAGKISIITFTSSSTVKNFITLLGIGPSETSLFENTRIACIGPITAKTASDLGLRCDIVAKEYTIPGLVSAILDNVNSIDMKGL